MTYNDLVTIFTESSRMSAQKTIERSYESQLYPLLSVREPLKAITGLRRSGKSFLLKKLYRYLIEKNGIPQQNLFFVNFENDRLAQNRNLVGLRNMYELFLAHTDPQKPVYLFLDEIQNVFEWESFVRTIYDSTGHNIFITGSNSHLLSSEFSTSLGGRILEFNILPFSFKEFLLWNNVTIPRDLFELSKNKTEIASFLNQYLRFGGLPETFGLPETQKISYRETLMEKIIINDILDRFDLKHPDILKNLCQFLQGNVGNITSVRNVTTWIRNLGEKQKLDPKTVQTYIDYLEKTYLIGKLKKFSLKTKEIFSTQNKYYFLDNLFCQESSVEDQLENVVFQHFIRKNVKDLYYGRNDKGQEIDFIVSSDRQAFQICYQLNDDNVNRETKLLGDFDNANLICVFDERSIKTTLPKIKMIPLDQLLLEI